MKSISTLLSYIALFALLGGCTTMQTTYFRGSFQPLEDVNAAGFYPYSGESSLRQVSDMGQAAKDMYNEGYAMIGYSQFVSPLYKRLAPGYATKYANSLKAEVAVMETPRPGPSNLHGYLVTYWARVRPDAFGLGVYSRDLPEDLLRSLGQDYNVVYLAGVVPGTPAHEAGLKPDDVILAVNGQRVTSNGVFADLLRRNRDEAIVIGVSRYGRHLEIEVRQREPAVASAGFGYQSTPWQNTAPRDWSMLSAANLTILGLQQQQQQRQVQAAYERGRAEAAEASTYVSQDVTSAYSRYGVQPLGGPADGIRRSYSRMDRVNGLAPPPQWSTDFRGAMSKYKAIDYTHTQGDSLAMFFSNYPSVYGHLYSYPAGN